MQRAPAEQLFALKVTLCAQISRCRSKLRWLAVAYAVLPLRTNRLLVAVLAGTTRALKSNPSTPTNISVNFFLLQQDILIFHFTQSDSSAFPR